MIKINIENKTDYLLVSLGGMLDGSQAGPVSHKINLALVDTDTEQNIETNLIIDISDLQYISSGGLGLLLSIHRKVNDFGYKMIICNPSAMVSDLLTTTGMYGVLQVQPSVSSAVKTLKE